MEEIVLGVVSNSDFGRDGVKQVGHVQFISRFCPGAVWIFVELMDSPVTSVPGFCIQNNLSIQFTGP